MTIDYYGSGFLEGLPHTIHRHPYKGKEQFQDTLRLEYDHLHNNPDASEWVIFEIDEQAFARDFLSNIESAISKSWTSFDVSSRILLAKMPTPEHSNALTAFHNAIYSALQPMGLHKALQAFPATTVTGDRNAKQGDHGWGPLRPPRGRSRKWPTVVLEVAVSETRSKLQSDVRFWLGEAKGDVNIVFTLAINRQKPEVTIEKWELENNRPHRTQCINVSKGTNDHITVRNDPLVIEFEKLFLREPSVPKEKDIIIDRNELEDLATSIWLVQDI
ncbi:hypothetical protein PHISP_05872 [Aspergillus sp. HF37]|nr:hypothetical protein PHISP_05872 [Aspergillus sp. HF37]